MKPWVIDAGANDAYTTEELSHFTPISSKAVAEFLLPSNTDKTVLVAPKGYGKTLLLKKKAADLRLQHKDAYIHPSNAAATIEFVRIHGMNEKITDWKWEKRFGNMQAWSEIWMYAIGFMVCRNEGRRDGADTQAIEVANAIESMFRSGVVAKRIRRKKSSSSESGPRIEIPHEIMTVRNFLSSMLLNWDTNSKQYCDLYTNIAQRTLDNLRHNHFLFLDSPDEAMNWDKDGGVGKAGSNEQLDLWGTYPKHWVNFNLGLVDAIRQLKQMYGHIRVFTSVRSEALNAGAADVAVATQYKAFCVRLTYTKEDLKAIFVRNIKLMAEEDCKHRAELVNPQLSDDIVRDFVGIGRCLHVPTGKEEDMFDAIVRHTRWTPRDLMIVGKMLMELDVEVRRKCTSQDLQPIRDVIDAASHEFWENQQGASIPRWSSGSSVSSELNAEIGKFATNIIHNTSLRIHSPLDRRKEPGGCPFDYLYSQGLLGWIGFSVAGQKPAIQFLDANRIAAKGMVLPLSRWYAFHPILYGFLRSTHGPWRGNIGYLSSYRAIVGNGEIIEPPYVLFAECNQSYGVVSITGGRIFQVNLHEDGVAATVLLTLVAHAFEHKTLSFEYEGVIKTFNNLQRSCNALRIPQWTDIFDGGTDETKKINRWLGTALCGDGNGINEDGKALDAEKRIRYPMRFRYEKKKNEDSNNKVYLDGIDLDELKFKIDSDMNSMYHSTWLDE